MSRVPNMWNHQNVGGPQALLVHPHGMGTQINQGWCQNGGEVRGGGVVLEAGGTLLSACCQASPDASPASTPGGFWPASWSSGGPPGLGPGLVCSPVVGPGASGHISVLWMDVLSWSTCPRAPGGAMAASVGEAGPCIGVRVGLSLGSGILPR